MKWLKTLLGTGRGHAQPELATTALRAVDDHALAELYTRIADLLARGTAADALAVAREAVDRYPDDVELNVLCGRASLNAGDAEGALDAFHLAAHYDPGHEEILGGRISALTQLGRAGEVVQIYEEFLLARPHHVGALLALARFASDVGDFPRARELLEQAVDRHPDDVGVLNDLGLLVAREFADFARGEAHLRRALAIAPGASHARINLGWVLCERGADEEGLQLLDEAIARDPGDDEARLIRAVCLLKRGDFAKGWDEYEVRHASPTARRRPFAYSVWDGESPSAGRLLVVGEQGLGDQIMFASCLPDVLARVSDCVVECEPRLGALLARSFPAARVVTGALGAGRPDWLGQNEPFQRQVALGSLPRLFRRHAADFPAHSGYLRADPARVSAWRQRLAAAGPGPKIGVSWRGGTPTSRRGLRSLDVSRLVPLMSDPRTVWVSLQYGDCRKELAELSRDAGVAIHHWQEAIDDYDESAALVCALDIVVSVCTSIVHLTGALGQRALVMVPFAAEWRYGTEGETIPWYPSVKLIRQPAPNDWDPVFANLRRELLTRESAGA